MRDETTLRFMRLRAGDSGLLVHAEDDVFDHEIEASRAETFLADHNHLLIVACHDGRVVGQVSAVVHRHIDAPCDLYIDNLGVAPAYRRRGIAARLVELTLEAGRDAQCAGAWVVTDSDNRAAKKFYRRSGAREESVSMFSYGSID